MKKFVIIIILSLMSLYCFAQVTTEIIAKDIDINGNIRIWTCHKIDGVEVESRYPKMDGHFVYATRYSKQSFKDCEDKIEIETYILNDVKNHSNILIQKEFDKNASKTFNQIKVDYNTQANQDFINTSLDSLIGKGTTIVEVKKNIDTDNDGNLDKEITLNQNGTKIEEDIIIFID